LFFAEFGQPKKQPIAAVAMNLRYAVVDCGGPAEKPSPISVLFFAGDGIITEDYLTNI
jgi:hypothetical protein